MLMLRVLLLGIILLVIPTIVGSLFASVDRRYQSLPFMWVSGQMLLWAGFQVIAVPLVLVQGTFTTVVRLYSFYTAICFIWAVIMLFVRRKTPLKVAVQNHSSQKQQRKYSLWWILFWVILIGQLIASFFLAYADGDDAFYVATAGIAEESDTMYYKMPYTGGATELDVRHGLAPFPLWIAYLARITGIRTVTVAQLLVPPVLIAMAYAVYYLLGSKLFQKRKEWIPVFLVFVELLVLFGDYSMYTPEKFLIARSRQGKAALSAMIIPLLLYLLLELLEKLEEKQRMTVAFWGLLACTLTTACLCSTLGAVLTCMLIGIVGICGAVCYRKWKFLVPMAVCCVPCVVEVLLYLMY